MMNPNASTLPQIFHTIADWRKFRSTLPHAQPLAFVPTMGALHEGHGSLVKLARHITGPDGHVSASIFVNPTQFGPSEDLARYPRPFTADVPLLQQWGAYSLFAPEASEMYPHQTGITVDPGAIGDILEGALRPGHFRGVCTVVAKLLHIIKPTHLILGQKDFQQQLILRRLVTDLNIPVAVITGPTVREPDGLAMSSRNRYLSPTDRPKAAAIFATLQRTAEEIRAGQTQTAAVCRSMEDTLTRAGLLVDYAVVRNPETLQPMSDVIASPCVLLVAARLGNTRLIDNLIM